MAAYDATSTSTPADRSALTSVAGTARPSGGTERPRGLRALVRAHPLAPLAAYFALAFLGTWLAWRERYWSLAGRLHYTLVTLGALGFVWWLSYWNLLGFRF